MSLARRNDEGLWNIYEPIYVSLEDLEEKLEGFVLDYIRENHPGWDTEYGACDRCVEVYKLRAAGVV